MVIIGAKGFANEVLQIFADTNKIEDVAFYDDISSDLGDMMYGRFKILKNESQVKDFFKSYGTDFTLGIGNPTLRYKLCKKFTLIGGKLTSSISPKALIGSFNVKIGAGCNILSNAIFSNNSSIGTGCIVYYNVTVTHDCVIDDFVELSPGATLLGGCKIGAFSKIGSNATILPKLNIGKNVIIGAGAVVTSDIISNSVAVGVPAKIIKTIDPLI